MRSDYLIPQKYSRLFYLMTYENVLALRVALETGLRIDDILRAKPGDLDGVRLRYTAKKTGKTGVKKLSQPLARELARSASGEWLFPGRKPGKHRTRQAVWRDVKKASRVLGFEENVSPHSARKTYAVELRREEGLAKVQEELQHANPDTTMLYAFADAVIRPGIRGDVPGAGDVQALAEAIAEKVVEKLTKRWDF